MTAFEIEHGGWAVDHKTTDAEIAAYVAANRAECGVCPGTECFCDAKPPSGYRARRGAGLRYSGHTASVLGIGEDDD